MPLYLSLLLLTLSGCATHRSKDLCPSNLCHDKGNLKSQDKDDPSAKDPRDPWESFNRKVFSFNTVLDRTVFLPFIGFYRVMPLCAKNRITSVMDTLETPISMANCALQGKMHDFLAHTARLFFNLTFGLCGLFDFASLLHIKPARQDFGKTMEKMLGIPPGPFLIIPFLGPSSLRDALGQAVDCSVLPTTYFRKTARIYYPASYLITQSKIISIQYDLDGMFDDSYGALRNAYLMSREEEGSKSTDTEDQSPDLLGSEEGSKSTDTEDQSPDLLGSEEDSSSKTEAPEDQSPDLLGSEEDSSSKTDVPEDQSPDLLGSEEGSSSKTDVPEDQSPDLLD